MNFNLKYLSPIWAVASLFMVGCAHAQNPSGPSGTVPSVVVVPPDELSGDPGLSRATVPDRGVEASPQSTAPAEAGSNRAPVVKAPPRHVYNQCHVNGSYVAMTFDDGPHPSLTPRLLDILKERNIKATFYVVGKLAAQHPEILQRMVREGHEIGNHTWNHPSLTKLGSSRVQSEMDRTTKAIVDATGIPPRTMRPPYGATNSRLNQKMDKEMGMKVIMWSVDPLDWKYRNASRVASQIIEKTRPGNIVLAHDIHKTTVDAMPRALDALQSKGYKFVTVSELLEMDQPVEVASNQ